jgi:hypothetical protein
MAFPTSSRRAAWESFVGTLKSDPVLKREVKTWKTWSGDPKDSEDFSIGQEPYLRLTPHPDQSHFVDTQSQQADILVDVDCAIAGTNVSQSMDFWSAIETALYPKSAVARAAINARLRGLGIQSVEFLMGAWGVKNEGGQVLVSKGQIKLRYFGVLQPGN